MQSWNNNLILTAIMPDNNFFSTTPRLQLYTLYLGL